MEPYAARTNQHHLAKARPAHPGPPAPAPGGTGRLALPDRLSLRAGNDRLPRYFPAALAVHLPFYSGHGRRPWNRWF